MKQRYQQLATRFQEEIEALERVVNRITYVWPQAERATTDQDIYVESIALNLHGFYLGLERLFELTAKHIDQNLPGGERWHHDLLLLISRPTQTRPAVIGPNNATQLDEFRRFRHVVRNVYTTNLQADKIAFVTRHFSLQREKWDTDYTDCTDFYAFIEIIRVYL